jgi:hypothetical protein
MTDTQYRTVEIVETGVLLEPFFASVVSTFRPFRLAETGSSSTFSTISTGVSTPDIETVLGTVETVETFRLA